MLQKEQFLGKTKVWDHLPYVLFQNIRINFPEPFEHIVPTTTSNGFHLTAGATRLHASGWYADRAVPDMFTLRMLSASRDGLADPHSILLSASTAQALFGSADATGKTVLSSDR